ncbi:MAG TPA: serpin family protein [Terracidiphilus sp.]|jgi:serpin B
MKPLLSLIIACLVVPLTGLVAQTSPSATADQTAVVEGNNAFAIALYGQLRSQDGNLFFSPESISTALAMTYAGARGDTAAEMAKTLHFTLPPERLHPAMGALLSDLNAVHNGYQLRVADALWAQRDYVFLGDFLKLTKSDYGAGFNQVNFKGATEAARLTINQWVEQKTDNKIKDLLQPGVLDPLTKMVLTNAIYFKGDWRTPFLKAYTEDEDFHLSAARNVKAPLMHLTKGFDYLDGGTFQAVAIPYESGDLSMIVFLPKEIGGLPALEESMTASNMKQWLDQLHWFPKVILTMPKFKMTRQFGLAGTLGAMGMPRAFNPDTADFSGMTGKRELFISAVIHKAFIDVNEEGTEAAAATAVVMARPTAMPPRQEPPPIVFRADHPFVFLIRDNRSGGILFMGRVTDPTK